MVNDHERLYWKENKNISYRVCLRQTGNHKMQDIKFFGLKANISQERGGGKLLVRYGYMIGIDEMGEKHTHSALL